MSVSWIQIILPAVIAGIFGVISATLVARLTAAAERKRFERDIKKNLEEWQRDFANRYAEIVSKDPKHAEAVSQQFAGAYLYRRDSSERFFIPPGVRLTVGRDPIANIILNDLSLSRQHAIIEIIGENVWIDDLNSRNGVYLGEKPVRGRTIVVDGDILRFGNVELILKMLSKES